MIKVMLDFAHSSSHWPVTSSAKGGTAERLNEVDFEGRKSFIGAGKQILCLVNNSLNRGSSVGRASA